MYIFPASHGIYGLCHARDIYSLLGKEYIKSLANVKTTVLYIPCYARNTVKGFNFAVLKFRGFLDGDHSRWF